MNQPKIIFFDIDETLYVKNKQYIPPSVIERVLPRLKAKGIIPAIATGRNIGGFPNALTPLLNADAFELLVSINGQYNRFQDKVISHYPLPKDRIDQVIQQLQQFGIDYAFVTCDDVAVSTDTPLVRELVSPIKQNFIVDKQYHQRHSVYQLLAFFSETNEKSIIESGILGDDLKIIRWHQYAVDILNKHNSKARGISDVLRYFGWEWQDAMAFGDGLNDVEMLSEVGCGVAMGNAEPALKMKADFVTLPIEQDGILYALEKLGVI